MPETGKIASKKGKTGSVYSIVGVALVLLIMGIMGCVFLMLHQFGNTLKEEVGISAYLNTSNKDTIQQIKTFVASQPYAKDVKYIDKEAAKKIWNADNKEDWDNILDYNPLPESIDFYAKAQYVNKDSLAHIGEQLKQNFGNKLTEINYPQLLVNSMNEKSTKLGLVTLSASSICTSFNTPLPLTLTTLLFSKRLILPSCANFATLSAEAGAPRKESPLCTSVTSLATSAKNIVQSSAESPPPANTIFLSRKCSGSFTI